MGANIASANVNWLFKKTMRQQLQTLKMGLFLALTGNFRVSVTNHIHQSDGLFKPKTKGCNKLCKAMMKLDTTTLEIQRKGSHHMTMMT
jgi:hypothetical protein